MTTRKLILPPGIRSLTTAADGERESTRWEKLQEDIRSPKVSAWLASVWRARHPVHGTRRPWLADLMARPFRALEDDLLEHAYEAESRGNAPRMRWFLSWANKAAHDGGRIA